MSKEVALTNPLRDRDNPRSVINIVPSSISNALSYIPDSIFEMSVAELKKIVEPGVEAERLRVAFWKEYDQAQISKKNMNISNIYQGTCTQNWFLKKYVGNSFNLAYIMTPPLDYETSMMESLNYGIEQVREILALPHIDEKGKINAKLADVKVKIVESLLERVKGAVVSRVESRNLNVIVEKPNVPSIAEDSTPKLEEIKERLKLLESQAEGTVINVTGQEIEVTEEG